MTLLTLFAGIPGNSLSVGARQAPARASAALALDFAVATAAQQAPATAMAALSTPIPITFTIGARQAAPTMSAQLANPSGVTTAPGAAFAFTLPLMQRRPQRHAVTVSARQRGHRAHAIADGAALAADEEMLALLMAWDA